MKYSTGILIVIIVALVSGCSKAGNFAADNGDFKDFRDGHIYKWIRVSDQIWMAENLAYLPEIDSFRVGSTAQPGYFVPGFEYPQTGSLGNREILNLAKSSPLYSLYGVLYNWEAASKSCPSGWHLPSHEEWKLLESFLEMETSDTIFYIPNLTGTIGMKLKSSTGWIENGNGSDQVGFNALPAGYLRNSFLTISYTMDSAFREQGRQAFFWTSTETGDYAAMSRVLQYQSVGIIQSSFVKSVGFSVRCVKN